MDKKLVIVSVVVALLLGAYGAFRSAPAQVVERVIQEKQLGALAGPDIPYPYFSFGDVRQHALGASLTSATSSSVTGFILCAIQAPAATTTLVAATLRVNGNPYSNEFEISRSTTNTATTTRLALLVSAAADVEVIATTTATALTNGVVIPNSYIMFAVATGTPSTSWTRAGKCSAVFREI